MPCNFPERMKFLLEQQITRESVKNLLSTLGENEVWIQSRSPTRIWGIPAHCTDPLTFGNSRAEKHWIFVSGSSRLTFPEVWAFLRLDKFSGYPICLPTLCGRVVVRMSNGESQTTKTKQADQLKKRLQWRPFICQSVLIPAWSSNCDYVPLCINQISKQSALCIVFV